MNKKFQISAIALFLVIAILAIYISSTFSVKERVIVNDFESCVEAGNPVMESYPRQCRHKGETYVEKLEFQKDGIILMQNKETLEYSCFGCNDELCVDPAPIMKPARETIERYCSSDFEVIERGVEARKFYCDNESRNVDACITLYQPVCGWSDPEKVQCIKYPCATTYSNSCNACVDENVLYWTEGECPK